LSILTGLLTYFIKQAKNYKKLLEEQRTEGYIQLIHEEIKPLEKDLGELRAKVLALGQKEQHHIDIIQGSYKFRLIHLCKTYIRQQYITQDQFDQLSEFYKVYAELGGNGQAAEFYDKVLDLPIHD
jgi:hypothetical protein